MSEFKQKLTPHIKTLFDQVDYIEHLLLAVPSSREYDEIFYGYLLLFYEDNIQKDYNELIKCFIKSDEVPDFYLLNREEDKAFLKGAVAGIKEALEISKEDLIKENHKDDKPYPSIFDIFSDKNNLKPISDKSEPSTMVLYVKTGDIKKFKKELLDKSHFLLNIIKNDFKSMVSTIPEAELLAKEFTVSSSLELLSDLSSYFRHSNEYFINDILHVIVKTFPGIIKNIQFLRPILYNGDNQFEIFCNTDFKKSNTDSHKTETKTKLPEKIWKSFFEDLSFQTVESEGHLYEPVLSEHRVLSILKIEPAENAWTPEFNYRMSQKLVSILTYRVPYRRYVSVVTTLRGNLAKTNINKQIKDWEPDFLSAVSGELAKLFTAHACAIWVYDKYENRFYRRGTAGYIKELFDRDSLPFSPQENVVSFTWEKNGKVINIPENKKFEDLAFGRELKEQGFKKGIATSWKSSGDFGIVITMWSKLDNSWKLSDDDKNMLIELTNLISDSLKVKYDLYMLNRETDEAMTSLIHELKSPFSGIKGGVEYIDDLLDEIFKPSFQKSCGNVQGESDNEYAERIYNPEEECREVYSFEKLVNLVRWTKEFVYVLFQNLLETKDIISRNIFPSMHYLSEIIKFLSFYIKFNKGRVDFSHGQTIKIKFWGDLVNKLVKRTMYFYMKSKKLKLYFNFDERTFPNYLYMTGTGLEALKIIMYNLISNAIKYANEGTTIVLNGYVKNKNDKNNIVVIEVEDYGIGVPGGEEETIFQKWRRGSNASEAVPEGTGLGLYFSRELITALGGKLYLKQNSNPTIFLLEIPFKYFANF